MFIRKFCAIIECLVVSIETDLQKASRKGATHFGRTICGFSLVLNFSRMIFVSSILAITFDI